MQLTYVSKATIPNVGMTSRGLAYNPETDTFFTIGAAGNAPFGLIEFKLPTTINGTNKCSIVKNWGAINDPSDPLGMVGKALTNMKGLLYDVRKKGLWCNFGSYYANGQNLPVICFVRLNSDGTKTIFGPWKVPMSDIAKGIIMECPCHLMRLTKHRFMCFGVKGSTSQQQSWGLGLVTIEEPDLTLPPMSVLNTKVVSHWPMKVLPNGYQYSDFPRDPADKAKWITQTAEMDISSYSVMDGITSLVEVHGHMFGFGYAGKGYCWYGNANDYISKPSLLDPTKPCVSASSARGWHAEAFVHKGYRFSIKEMGDSIFAGNTSIKPGLMWTLDYPIQKTGMGQGYFNRDKDLVYMLVEGSGNLGAPDVSIFQPQ